MTRKRYVVAFILLCITGLVCARGNKEGMDEELTSIVLALDWVPNTNHIGAYLATALGYFAEEGLAVEIVQPAEASGETLVALGRAHFGYSYQEALTFARSAEDQLPIVALAAVIQHNTSGFASAKKIQSMSDLVGLTYGGWGSPVETAMLKTLLEAEGASLDDIRVFNTGSADFFSLTASEIDFSWVFQGWTMVEAEQRGINLSYIDLSELNVIFDYYTPIIISSEALLLDKPQLVRDFMRALSRGYEYATNHPNEAATLLVEAVPEIPLGLARASLAFLADEFIADAPRWGEMQGLVWERYADWLFENDLIPRRLNVESSFSNDYLPE